MTHSIGLQMSFEEVAKNEKVTAIEVENLLARRYIRSLSVGHLNDF